MWPLLLPPVAAPPPATDLVGVVWHDEATVDRAAKQRVLQAAQRGSKRGTLVIDGADRRARAIVAGEIDREVADRQVARLAALEAAEALYRSGQSAEALTASDTILADFLADPIAPGAAQVLVRVHLLRAQVQWTEGAIAAAEQELRSALHHDPEARTSTRRMPPDLVALPQRIAAELDGERARWATPRITLGDDALVELDGRAGLRPVPPGSHLVVVRRPGARPVAAFIESDWDPPPPEEILAVGLPEDAAAAQRTCDALALREILLVRLRGNRVGVQAFRCGDAFAMPWYGRFDAIEDGTRTALRAAVQPDPAQRIASDDAWPKLVRPGSDTPPSPTTKPWYRRAWVWTVLGTVVVGAVVTGAVVGTLLKQSAYGIDTDSFLGR
ncbi:MAG: hypothetical protein IPN32_35365 [Deltaproteobacteria bacterium]|nr:hypothetical protein [Deltaproteobacteria bacterium]